MHVAIIPDGNRRWARKNNLSLEDGYEKGILKFAEFIKWSIELGVNEVTAWGMSYDNYKNRSIEVWNSIKRILLKYYEKYKDEDVFQKYPEIKDINLKLYGFFDDLNEEDREKIELINSKLNGNKYKINILILYNGRIEMLYVINKLIKSNMTEVTLEQLYNNLLVNSFPDIVIRTGGHIRTSGFMPIQTEYSEWFFLDKLWPEFTKEDYEGILEQFKRRERNFGK